MRRILFPLLLWLLVVSAQQAALVHAIGHGAGHGSGAASVSVGGKALSESGSTEGGNGGGIFCDKCFQFGQVASAAVAQLPAVLLRVGNTELALGRPSAQIAADAPASRGRDPPTVV